MSLGKVAREFQCLEILPNGNVCAKRFTRKWNLTRHMEAQHQDSCATTWTFINTTQSDMATQQDCDVDDEATFSAAPPGDSGIDTILEQPPYQEAVIVPRLQISASSHAHGKKPTPAGTVQTCSSSQLAVSATRISGQNLHEASRSLELAPRPHKRKYTGNDDDWEDARKRPTYDRCRFQKTMPSYEVKTSKQAKGQIKALSWLSIEVKTAFDQYINGIVSSWGLSQSDSGACIVLPCDWSHLSPRDIAGRLTPQSCPLRDSRVAVFKRNDHQTTLARATAWFGMWPRAGIELDNFIECGPFQRMDASHLCHTPLCVNPSHITYEPADENQDRRVCQEHSRYLRTEGREVPRFCDRHATPCLMQVSLEVGRQSDRRTKLTCRRLKHAALTIYERCLIQIFVAHRAGLVEHVVPGTRPRWHKFDTFETQLPLQFVRDDPALLLTQARAQETTVSGPAKAPKPSLICGLCERIKAFGSVVHFWSHLVHSHLEESEDAKLDEAKRGADMWALYWKTRGEFTRDRPTTRKIQQVLSGSASWSEVLAWGLR